MKTVRELSYDGTNILGGGRNGYVFSGFYEAKNKNKKQVAIKRIQRASLLQNDDESISNNEVELMQKAGDHPNILRYIHFEKDADFLYIATELCSGTLQDIFYPKNDRLKKEIINVRDILHQVTEGLAHLHKKKIVHRDIKPSNILILVPSEGTESKPQMKLADFDISKILKTDKHDFTNTNLIDPNGTIGWNAPDVYNKKRLDFKVDIFALGLIFGYTLCRGKHPFGENVYTRQELIKEENAMLMKKGDMEVSYFWDSQAFAVIKSMLRTDSSKRPTVEDVLKHPFFIPFEDRIKYFEKLWSAFKDSLTTDQTEQLEEMLREIDLEEKMDSDNTPLHILCRYYGNDNLIDLVKLCFDQKEGTDVNAELQNGDTPLHLLCSEYEKGNMKDIVQLLIDNGADVNAKNEDGNTPLHSLCKNKFKSNQNFNRKDIFQFLIKNGANVNAVGQYENTPLHLLFKNEEKNNDLVDIVNLLMQKDVNVMAKDYNSDTPLHVLCKSKNKGNEIALIKLLTQKFNKDGEKVNAKNDYGSTPLHLLCSNNQKEDLKDIVKFLIDKCEANVNAKNNQGSTPLHQLCYFYNKDDLVNIIQVLIQERAKVNAKDRYDKTPLHKLCKRYGNKDFDRDRRLIDKGYGTQDLIDSVRLLIEEKADVNAKHRNGSTPLHYLCKHYKNGNLKDIIQLLIQNGADVKDKGQYGNTPLHLVCEYYNKDNLIDIVKLLIDNDARVDAKNNGECTPLHCVFKNDYIKEENIKDIIQLLLEQEEADVNAMDCFGNSPLYCLRKFYKNDNLMVIFQLLVEKGAEVEEIADLLRYHPNDIIGFGDFGPVFSGYFSQIPVAVKRIPLRVFLKIKSAVLQEQELVIKAKDHPNILRYISIKLYDNFVFIATELCRGTLQEYLNRTEHDGQKEYNGPRFESKKEILYQITQGLAHLHRLDIVHRNMKPANILIYVPSYDEITKAKLNPQIKLSDFGRSKIKDEDGWMAPELYQSESVNSKTVDIFALGLIFGYTLSLNHEHPFGYDPKDRVMRIKNREPMKMVRNDFYELYPEDGEIFDLIKSMLALNPDDRPTVESIVDSFFFPANRQKLLESIRSSFEKDILAESSIDEDSINVNVKLESGDTPLHIVCAYYKEDNLINLVQLLVKRGATVNASNERNGTTPLLNLLCYNYKQNNLIDILQFLIANEAEVNIKNKYGRTPLHYLCQNYKNDNMKEIAQLLVEKNADVNAKDENDDTPLHILCGYCEYDHMKDIVQFFLNSDTDVNYKNKYGNTPLHFLCSNYQNDNLKDIVRLLIENDAEVNTKNSNGNTPLHCLCKHYEIDNGIIDKKEENLRSLVHLLKKKGASMNEKDNEGATPSDYLIKKKKFMLAMHHRRHEFPLLNLTQNFPSSTERDNLQNSFESICKSFDGDGRITADQIAQFEKLLKDDSIDVNITLESGYTPLHILCANYTDDNLFHFIRLLIEKGAKVNTEGIYGRTPLGDLCGAYRKDNLIDIIKLLIRKGAEVNTQNRFGWTPLHSLCRCYQNDNLIDIVKLFIEKGAEVNTKTENGQTPLLSLCNNYKNDNLMEIVRLLIGSCANVNTEVFDGKTQLHVLCHNMYNKNDNLIHIVQLLIEKGAEVNAKDKYGWTPLYYLCKEYENDNLIDIVQLMIEKGAEVNTKNSNECVPLHLLCKYYKNDNLLNIVQLLIEKGADVGANIKHGTNLLHLLCYNYKHNNLIHILRLLIEKGVEINAKNEDDDTALLILFSEYTNDNLIDIVQLLVEKGADVNVKKKNGNTPLHELFREYKNDNLINIVQFLIKNDARAYEKNKKGSTPLHLLCRYYKIDNATKEEENLRSLVRLFLENGASMDAENKEGKTPNHFLNLRTRPIILAMPPTNLPVAVDVLNDPIVIDEIQTAQHIPQSSTTAVPPTHETMPQIRDPPASPALMQVPSDVSSSTLTQGPIPLPQPSAGPAVPSTLGKPPGPHHDEAA